MTEQFFGNPPDNRQTQAATLGADLMNLCERGEEQVLFFRGEETETEREQQRADIEAFIEMLED